MYTRVLYTLYTLCTSTMLYRPIGMGLESGYGSPPPGRGPGVGAIWGYMPFASEVPFWGYYWLLLTVHLGSGSYTRINYADRMCTNMKLLPKRTLPFSVRLWAVYRVLQVDTPIWYILELSGTQGPDSIKGVNSSCEWSSFEIWWFSVLSFLTFRRLAHSVPFTNCQTEIWVFIPSKTPSEGVTRSVVSG